MRVVLISLLRPKPQSADRHHNRFFHLRQNRFNNHLLLIGPVETFSDNVAPAKTCGILSGFRRILCRPDMASGSSGEDFPWTHRPYESPPGHENNSWRFRLLSSTHQIRQNQLAHPQPRQRNGHIGPQTSQAAINDCISLSSKNGQGHCCHGFHLFRSTRIRSKKKPWQPGASIHNPCAPSPALTGSGSKVLRRILSSAIGQAPLTHNKYLRAILAKGEK